MTDEQTVRIKTLIESLDSDDPDDQQSVAIELIDFGAIAVDYLIAALEHASWRVRHTTRSQTATR